MGKMLPLVLFVEFLYEFVQICSAHEAMVLFVCLFVLTHCGKHFSVILHPLGQRLVKLRPFKQLLSYAQC